MTSRNLINKLEKRHVAEQEAKEIQLAIELLNRYGFEHHIANHILQVARNNRWLLSKKITDELSRENDGTAS